MPKIIELTVEIDVNKVSCPGVWLCQDGRVSLTVFTLGTTYQTCMLPPVFPLMFKDVFYFRKRFQESCALNNICCLLKDETIYCELVQWSKDCVSGACTILAQYLGSLNDVLFPPNLCSNDGVDLLMRRSKEFPGILSPKIEIATKVRIDELWSPPNSAFNPSKAPPCRCPGPDHDTRQKQVCHSAQYHRIKCAQDKRSPTGSRSRSRSAGSQSCCSLTPENISINPCRCPSKPPSPRVRSPRPSRPSRPAYSVYTVGAPDMPALWRGVTSPEDSDDRRFHEAKSRDELRFSEDRQKLTLESRYVDTDLPNECSKNTKKLRIAPCVCEICKRYHELFHLGTES